MSISVRSVGPVIYATLAFNSGSSFSPVFPAVQAGDICVLWVNSGGTTARIQAGAGWTEFGPNASVPSGSTVTGRLYWRRAVGTETGTAASVSIGNLGGSGTFAAYIVAFSGAILNGSPIAHAITWSSTAAMTVDTSLSRFPVAAVRGVGASTGESWPGLTGVTGVEQINNSNGVLLYTATATGGTSSVFTFSRAGGTPGAPVPGANGFLYDLLPAVAPYAPSVTAPVTGSTIALDLTQRLAWTFSAPDPYETQSHFDIQYRQGTGVWQTISGSTPNPYVDIPPGTFAPGAYEWQVRTTGQLGLPSPWSSSAFFTAANSPAGPVIIAPINNSTVGLSQQPVQWSAPDQTAYEVRRVADNAGAPDTGTIYWTSGQVAGATTRSIIVPFPVNNHVEHLQISVQSGGVWSPFTDARVQVSYTPPHIPQLILSADVASGAFLLAITDPTPVGTEPAVVSVDVYRSEGGGPLERVAAGIPPSTPWLYRLPASSVDYAFMVRANGANGITSDSAVVSVIAPSAPPAGAPASGYQGGYSGGY